MGSVSKPWIFFLAAGPRERSIFLANRRRSENGTVCISEDSNACSPAVSSSRASGSSLSALRPTDEVTTKKTMIGWDDHAVHGNIFAIMRRRGPQFDQAVSALIEDLRGDTLVVNANAEGGSLVVETLDVEGKVIEGFARADCTPITTDGVRHVVKWKGQPDCHLLQARPITLRFHLKRAKLYSFEPTIRHNHYLQSYD